jgi:prepilin-type N-terminal cleavage/methylation domain-containing protein
VALDGAAEAGFTLLELLVAVTVFAAVAVGGLGFLARFAAVTGVVASMHPPAGSPVSVTLGAVEEETAAMNTLLTAVRGASSATVPNPTTLEATGAFPDGALAQASSWTVAYAANEQALTVTGIPAGASTPVTVTLATHVTQFQVACMSPQGTVVSSDDDGRDPAADACFDVQRGYGDSYDGVEIGIELANTPPSLADWAWARP